MAFVIIQSALIGKQASSIAVYSNERKDFAMRLIEIKISFSPLVFGGRNFPQGKPDSEINVLFLLNEHGDLYFYRIIVVYIYSSLI